MKRTVNRSTLRSMNRFLILGVLIPILFSASCGFRRGKIAVPEAPKPVERPDTQAAIEKRLREEYRSWRGAAHQYGGEKKNGVDCSAFVRAMYQTVFGIDLPRSTKEQVLIGHPVRRRDLRPGDLVFFRPPFAPRHVGIYLSRNEFVHVSKEKGVTISVIGPDYWDRYYWTSRRVLPFPEAKPP